MIQCCYGNTAGGVLLLKKPTEMTSAAHDRTVLSGLVEFLGEGIALFFSLSMSKLQIANLISVEAKPEVRDVQVKVNKPATSGDLATWERVRRLFWKSSKFCEQCHMYTNTAENCDL